MGLKAALLACVGFIWLLQCGVKGTDLREGPQVTNVTSEHGLIHLGQQWSTKLPVLQATVNLTSSESTRSIFEFRTLDHEGLIFYGDTHGGADWFVLVLRKGRPEMQIKKADILSLVSGGPRLNDGMWHQVEVRSDGMFVVLEVDRKVALLVGLDSPLATAQGDMTGPIRLALGGMLRQEKDLLQPLVLKMDGCIRRATWLNIRNLWEADLHSKGQACFPDIKSGSYFSGQGLVVFNTSDSHSLPFLALPSHLKDEDQIIIEIEGRIEEWTGSFLNIKNKNNKSVVFGAVNNETKEVTVGINASSYSTPLIAGMNSLVLILAKHLNVIRFGLREVHEEPVMYPTDWRSEWSKGMLLAFGGLLGDSYDSGFDYLHGCIDKIKIQKQEVDLDRALYKHDSITSHSCPVPPNEMRPHTLTEIIKTNAVQTD